MIHRATLAYDKTLLRQATFAFWRHTVGLAFPLVLTALTAYVAYLWAMGNRTWEIGVLATVAALGFCFSGALYFVHYRNALEKLRDMGAPEAQFIADSESFTVSSGIGSSSLKWSSVLELWCFEDFWLVLFSKAQLMTIPLKSVSQEMQAFVLERVASSGGKVVR